MACADVVVVAILAALLPSAYIPKNKLERPPLCYDDVMCKPRTDTAEMLNLVRTLFL